MSEAESRYELRQLFGEDAFYDTLDDVMKDYQQQTGSNGLTVYPDNIHVACSAVRTCTASTEF